MISASDRVVALCTQNKINKTKRYTVAPIHKINTIVTNIDPNDSIFDDFKEKGLEIL
jgi:DeoR/GlpR family transcriptional regulator of sugar metabolism